MYFVVFRFLRRTSKVVLCHSILNVGDILAFDRTHLLSQKQDVHRSWSRYAFTVLSLANLQVNVWLSRLTSVLTATTNAFQPCSRL